jgi:hypothetical protein
MKYSLRSLMPKRSWFQFSLKTMLVGMTALCIGPLSFVANERSKAKRQKAAVEAIEKLGGSVEYDRTVPPRLATMRQILGDESFGNVANVSFQNTQVTDRDLVHLDGLTRLETLSLENTLVTDAGLEHLSGLSNNLDYLWLDNMQVTDAGLAHLAGLKGLRHLWLANTQVTNAGVAELQKALPNCRIYR